MHQLITKNGKTAISETTKTTLIKNDRHLIPAVIPLRRITILPMVRRGDMNVVAIVAVATAGALVGALVNYFLSMLIGRPIVYKFADSRLGHALLIDRDKVEKAEAYFDRHGAVSTFIGRLIPAIRQLISIPAGLARMNIWIFMIFTSLGAMVWNAILAGMGVWLAHTVSYDDLFAAVEKYNGYLTLAGIGLFVLCVLYITYHAMRGGRKKGDAK